MNIYQILRLCARIRGHEEQYRELRGLCSRFDRWQDLLNTAELHGMSPLLRMHLRNSGCVMPDSARRSLNITAQLHEKEAARRSRVLTETIITFTDTGLTPLVIKGGALCHTLYPEPALRPMRDLDILLREEEVAPAVELLCQQGFEHAHSPVPPDHFHDRPLFTMVEGQRICIEIHRGLFPDCPPYYRPFDFESLLYASRTFQINGIPALTFGLEDMLWHVYQHGFRPPLTYEPYRLINAADLIGLTETYFDRIDWERMAEKYPRLYNALPLLHHISPWDPACVSRAFLIDTGRGKRRNTSPYRGWPAVRLKDQKAHRRSILHIVTATFCPPLWWVRVYYGISGWGRILFHYMIVHPRHIFWWVRLYWSLVPDNEDQEIAGGAGARKTTGVIQKFRNVLRKLS